MNCTLYWFMLLMLYLNLLFVNNSVVEEANYTDSESIGITNNGLRKLSNKTDGKSLLIKDIGFTVKVHQKTFKSLVAYRSEGTVLMADTFENGTTVRSFRIVDGKSHQSLLALHTYKYGIHVYWSGMKNCKSQRYTSVSLEMLINKDGTIQYHIQRLPSRHDECPMTIEITDGIYIGGVDGSGTIIEEKVIHKKVYPSSSIVDGKVFTFVPQPRCRAQLSELSCTAESLLNANCSWCSKCDRCVQNTSICNCSEKVETTVSEENGLNDNRSPRVAYTKHIYYILAITLGLFVIFIVCLILWKYLYKQY